MWTPTIICGGTAYVVAKLCLQVLILFIRVDVSLCQTQTSVFLIEENMERNSVVGQVSISGLTKDPVKSTDSHAKQKYVFTSLAHGLVADHFRIDQKDGTIYAARKIDRETLCQGQLSRTRRSDSVSAAEPADTSIQPAGSTEELDGTREVKRRQRTIGDYIVGNQVQTCEIAFQVHVTAHSDSGPTENLLHNVQIRVADVNDNVPTFYSGNFVLKIPEGSPVDAIFRLPQATDLDSGIHSVTAYRLARPLNGSPVYHQTHGLQCAHLKSNYAHQRQAVSETHLDASTRNENAYLRGTHNTSFTVHDGQETFAYGGDYFVVEPVSQADGSFQPVLKQIRLLDRETTAHLHVCLLAEDGGGNTGAMMISIEVVDVNDNVPQWQGLPYRVSLPECNYDSFVSTRTQHIGVFQSMLHNSPGVQLLYTLTATDSDAGSNGQVSYRLSQQELLNQKLTPGLLQMPNIILRENKVYVVSKLDFEKLNRFTVPVEAVDGGGLSNFTEIEVTVEDCNDHAPTIFVIPLGSKDGGAVQKNHTSTFLGDFDVLWVREEDEARIDLATILAEDRDADDNGLVTCQLEGGTVGDRVSGYTMLVELRQISTNDHPAEEAATHFGRVQYGLNTKRTQPTVYTLFKREGVKFDREQLTLITVSVVCTDNGRDKPLTTRNLIHIRVSDINDNPPKSSANDFEDGSLLKTSIQSQTLHIPENEQFGSIVGIVQATDADEGQNAYLNYNFLNPMYWPNISSEKYRSSVVKGEDFFELDQRTGRLYTHLPLDRETNATLTAYVKVTDSGTPPLSSIIRLLILVDDVNDSPPIFTVSPDNDAGNGRISFRTHESNGESRVHGRLVGQLKAEDADFGMNQTVYFAMVESSLTPSGLPINYRVTPDGSIYADGCLDREQAMQHQFTVRVVDGGPIGHQLTSSAVVTVHLIDLNDSPPRFISPPQNSDQGNSVPFEMVNVSVNTPPGSVLYRIHARDVDEPDNTNLKFNLRSAKFLADYFLLREVDVRPSIEQYAFTEAACELILVNPLNQLNPGAFKLSNTIKNASHSPTKPPSSSLRSLGQQPSNDYFLYIIVKDSDGEHGHSVTARIQVHVYQDIQVPMTDRSPELQKLTFQKHNTTRQPAFLIKSHRDGANAAQAGGAKRNPVYHGDSLAETSEVYQDRGRSGSVTLILAMAVAVICIFLGVFCFVAFLYLRVSKPRTGFARGPRSGGLVGKAACQPPSNLPVAMMITGNLTEAEDPNVYWDMFTSNGVRSSKEMVTPQSEVAMDRVGSKSEVGCYGAGQSPTLAFPCNFPGQLGSPTLYDNRLRNVYKSYTTLAAASMPKQYGLQQTLDGNSIEGKEFCAMNSVIGNPWGTCHARTSTVPPPSGPTSGVTVYADTGSPAETKVISLVPDCSVSYCHPHSSTVTTFLIGDPKQQKRLDSRPPSDSPLNPGLGQPMRDVRGRGKKDSELHEVAVPVAVDHCDRLTGEQEYCNTCARSKGTGVTRREDSPYTPLLDGRRSVKETPNDN